MNDKNLIIENKKPTETIQEIEENTWSQELEVQEREILEQIEVKNRTDEQGFYVAEAVETEKIESNLAHQPTFQTNSQTILDPSTGQPAFIYKVKLDECYLSYDNFLTTFLWRDGKKWVKKLDLEKVEEAQDLLEQLENGKVRMVDDIWGWESSTITKTKNRLKRELRRVIKDHEEGKIVTGYFLDIGEWYA
jgi:hypothetical protein